MQTKTRNRITAVALAIGSAFAVPAATAQSTTTGDVNPPVGPGNTDFGAVTLFVGNTATGSKTFAT